MLRLDNNETMSALNGVGFSDIAKVALFRGVWKNKNGQEREVEVQIEERKSSSTGKQVYITAKTIDDGERRFTSGSGGNTLEEVLATVNWSDLD